MTSFDRLKQMVQELTEKSLIPDNNGTQGMTIKAYVYSVKEITSDEKRKLAVELAKAQINGDIDLQKEIKDKMEAAPSNRLMMTLRLVDVIPHVKGTKKIVSGNKIFHPEMRDVSELDMTTDYLQNGFVKWGEPIGTAPNIVGEESEIYEITLTNAMIEVTEPIIRNNNVIVPKKAYITSVAASTLQTLGSITYNMDRNADRIKRLSE